jgi:2-polyprenyl-6-methoxyphenol hydroxylase-like FAD-dependent oxidoreductase
MAMTSSSRSRPTNTESRAHASSTATPALKRELDADLVVDAMGRSARAPNFSRQPGLGSTGRRALGGQRELRQSVDVNSGGCRQRENDFCLSGTEKANGWRVSVYEHDAWIFTVARLAQNEPPGDLATLIRMATQFAPPALLRALKRGEPLGDVAVLRYPGGAWRRYDQMQRFPAGLLVFGDAICSTNPIYGQGMTVAALEATALQECLAEANGDLGQRFFAAAGEVIGPLWASNQFNDLYMPTRTLRIRPRKSCWTSARRCCLPLGDSPALAEKLFRSMNLVDPPTDYSPLRT